MSVNRLALPQAFMALASASLCIASAGVQAQAVPGGTLDPTVIPKYVTPLVIPPVLYDDGGAPMSVEVAQRQFSQQVLPSQGCPAASAAQVAAGGPEIVCSGDAFPETTLWGYGNPEEPATFYNPSFTFEITKDTETRVKWKNQLVADPENCTGNNPACDFLPHIIQDENGVPVVDQTLHWAAPNNDCRNGVMGESDCRGNTAEPYLGPIPMVVHVHGAHVGPGSDGYPEAWWLPDAGNIDCEGLPPDRDNVDNYICNGTFFESAEGADTEDALGKGYAIDIYSNDQPTTTLWYHDHTLGMTRLNVYAAAAGFWLIRDANDGETGLLSGVLPRPAPVAGEDPNGNPEVRNKIREIPVAIQPKSFYADGDHFYPADRALFEGLGTGSLYADNMDLSIPFLPASTSDIAPVWNPEAFFNTMVVNGRTWPVLEVAPERYRLRLLNATDSRFLNLAMFRVRGNGQINTSQELPFYQIGAEQSLLPQVVRIESGFATALPGDGRDVCPGNSGGKNPTCVPRVPGTFPEQALLMGPAERADVIVDFTGLDDGTRIRIVNTAPDAPFGGFPDVPADPATTGQVMEFVVNSALANPTSDPSTPAPMLALDPNPGGVPKLGPSGFTQDLALLEEESALICVDVDAVTGAVTQVDGSVPPDCSGGGVPFGPKEAVLGVAGSTGGEVQLWDDPIAQNPGVDDIETWELWNWSADGHPIHLHLVKFEVVNREIIGGAVRGPEPWEAGWKDTVIAYPGEVTRVKAKFDIPGLYVWHCHILSHEDNEMMVPYCVGEQGVDCPVELF